MTSTANPKRRLRSQQWFDNPDNGVAPVWRTVMGLGLEARGASFRSQRVTDSRGLSAVGWDCTSPR